ncbi:MAG: hypothetical protein QHH00_01635 [Methanomassiliicoccales archaeon]|jgi:hypothetical protein|nr:hypothetical protein [Methanomassiliicoccales archaeon]
MNTNLLIAGAIGFASSMALMFWTLRDYTYPRIEKPFFDDRKVFGLFALGLVLGIVIFSAQTYFPLAVVVVALAFALVEELIKLIILNIPKFQKKPDTGFYGLALGFGIGSTIAFGAVYLTLSFIDEINIWAASTTMILALQIVFLHGSTGATIGIGVARGTPWGLFAQAALVHLVYNLMMIPFYMSEFTFGALLFIIAFIFLVSYYLYVHYRLIPDFVFELISKFESRSKH